MKITFIGTEPEKDTRLLKLVNSCATLGIRMEPLVPTYRSRKGGRIFSGILRYFLYMVQTLFSRSSAYWVANAPDIVAIPLILARKRYVYDFRSIWSKEMFTELGNGLFTKLARKIEHLAMKHASIIVLNTDTLEKDALLYKKPTFLVANYPSKEFKATVPREAFRKEKGIGDQTKIILFVGRISVVEGVDLFENILETIVKLDNAVFWVVGDGPLMDQLKKLKNIYPGHLMLFGWVDYAEVPNFINASDICVVPRHENINSMYYNENGLLKLSEYMLFEKPVVCTGLAHSRNYLLVKEENLGTGILKALDGKAPVPVPKTWEQNAVPELVKVLKKISEL